VKTLAETFSLHNKVHFHLLLFVDESSLSPQSYREELFLKSQWDSGARELVHLNPESEGTLVKLNPESTQNRSS